MPNIIGLFKAPADRYFSQIGINAISIRYGDSEVIRPSPIVTPMGIQPDSPISSELTISGQGYETYTVSLPDDTLKSSFGNLKNAIAALQSNNIWYVNRNDGQGWRRCRTWGTYRFNQIGKYEITLKELGANDYGV